MHSNHNMKSRGSCAQFSDDLFVGSQLGDVTDVKAISDAGVKSILSMIT